MEPFVEQCVEKYLELANKKINDLKKAPTPTLDDGYFTDAELEAK